MKSKTVSEDLCHERTRNMNTRLDKIDKRLEIMSTNCLPHIKTDMATVMNEIKHMHISFKEIKELLKPKEKTKLDKDVVMLAFKIIALAIIAIILLISGQVEKGYDLIMPLLIGG